MFCICVIILQAEIESRVQCYILLSRVSRRRVWWSVTNMPAHELQWLQWSVAMLITSRLAGVSYEWLTVSRHCVEK